MKKEKYYCTEIFRGAFGHLLAKGERYHYFAYHLQGGGEVYSSDGTLVGRINWNHDGDTVTVSIHY